MSAAGTVSEEARLDVAIVGAGPFGLSAAAWLHDLRACVFGTPMQTWRTLMPPDMLLRSAWEESSLAAPGDAGSLDSWIAATGGRRREPIPLHDFLRYADWFRERFVATHDAANIASLDVGGSGYVLGTTDGRAMTAPAVVVAVGITPFPTAPAVFAPHLGDGVRFAIDVREFDDLADCRVVVVGAGQAGLESAGLAARAGAAVELVTRSRVRWFADREPHHERGTLGQKLYRFAYPVVGFGPPPLNRLVLHPDLFATLPPALRSRLSGRILRSGGSPWVRSLVDGKVAITTGASVTRVARSSDGRLQLALTDGSKREADRVLLATGYRFDLARLSFLSDELRARVAVENGWPVVDRRFESSVPGLFFVGYGAEGRFGPLSRFVIGTGFTMPRLRDGVIHRAGGR